MDAIYAGVEWKTLNAAQKQLRRDMMPLYGTPRALLQLRAGSTLRGHSYLSLFSLQVDIIVVLTHAYLLTQMFPHSFCALMQYVYSSGAGHPSLLCHASFCQVVFLRGAGTLSSFTMLSLHDLHR